MALNKVTYSPGDVLTADQMNKIQDAVISAEGNIEQHFSDINPHNVTVEQIGAATANHTHNISDVTNLQTTLNGKASSSHTHTKSQITDFPSSMPASDVYSWAKASTKPTYTASEVGAAPSSHNHSASNITSGTLAVARGGTGVTANPSMLTNLASNSAASVFAASPRPGVTGTLPIANGGTGATSAAAALAALGGSKIVIGTYVGTGSGKGTENQKWIDVSVGFHPRFVWVWYAGANHSAAGAYDIDSAVATREHPRMHQNVMIMEVTSTGFRALHWTNMGDNYDTYLNYAGQTYNYLAIG